MAGIKGSIAINRINIVGQKFNRLTVIEALKVEKGHLRYRCICDCGNEKIATSQQIREGKTASCGCLQKERASQATYRHGMSKTPIHNTWWNMIQRCTDPKCKAYKDYGARGITVSDEWLIFENFYRDMGDKPNDLTLDRIDNNKGYSKENCQWVSKSEQANNRRSNKYLTYNGETLTYAQWETKLKLRKGLIWDRLNKGWTIEKTLSTPVIVKYI